MTPPCTTWFRSSFLSYEILLIPLRRRPLHLQLFLREKEGGRTGGTTDSLSTSEKSNLESGLEGNRCLSDVPLSVIVAGGAKGTRLPLPLAHWPPIHPFHPNCTESSSSCLQQHSFHAATPSRTRLLGVSPLLSRFLQEPSSNKSKPCGRSARRVTGGAGVAFLRPAANFVGLFE